MRKIFALSILAFSVVAHSQNLSYTSIVRSWVDADSQEFYEQNNPNLVTSSVTSATGYSTSSARIAPGVNSVSTQWGSMNANNPAYSLIGDAQTYWTDTVTISDPALNGTVGTFSASLRVFGSATFGLTGGYSFWEDPVLMGTVYGFWDSWIGTSTDGGDSYLVQGWFGDWVSNEDGNVYYSGDELNQPQTEVELEFIYGQPFLLRMNMEAYMDAQNVELLPGTVEGVLDFSHTAYWNGISSFRDSNGNLVNPNFVSESGIDWRMAVVPEPATMSLLILPALALIRRKRTLS